MGNYKEDLESLAGTEVLDNAKKEFDELQELSEELLLKNDELELEIQNLNEDGRKNSDKILELENQIFENNNKISDLENKIKNLFDEEVKNLADILDIKISEEDFSNSEKKSEILKEIIKTISSLKENFYLLRKANGKMIKNFSIYNDKIKNLGTILFLEFNEDENFDSIEGVEKIFVKIFEKIKELIENFSKGGEKELDKKDEEIKNLSNLINKIKGEKNYLAQNKKSLESENYFLQEKNSDLIISKQNFELENSNNGKENEIVNSQIVDLSIGLKLSESEIQILKLAFDEVLDEKISLEGIIGKLEEKLIGGEKVKETLIGVVNNLSEERNKISGELEKIKVENSAQKETIENQKSEIYKQAEDILNKNGKISELNEEIKKIRNDNLISDEVKKKRISELEGEIKRLKKESQEKEDENSELKGKMNGFNQETLEISSILNNGMIDIDSYKVRLDKIKNNSNTNPALELAKKILKK